jgi:transposase-like protein
MDSANSTHMDERVIAERMRVIASLPAPTTTAARRRVVAMRIASGESVVMIARNMEIPARTIYHWMCNREYKEYIEKIRSAVLGEALGRLVDASTAAAETQIDIMLHDPDSSVRLRASGMVIETLIRLREHQEFDRRIRLLEERHGQAIEADGFEGDDFDDDGGDGLPTGPPGAADAGPAEEEMD